MNGNLILFDLRKTYLTGIRMALATCCSTTVSLLQVLLPLFVLTLFWGNVQGPGIAETF
jgi:hypothetical protein